MPARPLSPYAVQKVMGEAYVRTFSELFGLEGVCLRYFNIFGPRQSANSPYSGVIACFIRQMIEGKTPTIYGNGEQSRDFTFIDNVVSANILACQAPASKVNGRVFNIGCGASQSLNTLYETLALELQHRGTPLYQPARLGDVLRSEADVMQAKLWLNYEPRATFEEGLRQTVDWYLQQQGGLTGTKTQTGWQRNRELAAEFAN